MSQRVQLLLADRAEIRENAMRIGQHENEGTCYCPKCVDKRNSVPVHRAVKCPKPAYRLSWAEPAPGSVRPMNLFWHAGIKLTREDREEILHNALRVDWLPDVKGYAAVPRASYAVEDGQSFYTCEPEYRDELNAERRLETKGYRCVVQHPIAQKVDKTPYPKDGTPNGGGLDEREAYEDSFGVLRSGAYARLTVEDDSQERIEAKIIGHNVRVIDGVEYNVPLYSMQSYPRVHERIHSNPTFSRDPRHDWGRFVVVQGNRWACPTRNSPLVPVAAPPEKSCVACHLKFADFLPVAKRSAKESDNRSRYMKSAEFGRLLFDEGDYNNLLFISESQSFKLTRDEKAWFSRFKRGSVQPWDIELFEFEYILAGMLAKKFPSIAGYETSRQPSVAARGQARRHSKTALAKKTAQKWRACLFTLSSSNQLAKKLGVNRRWIDRVRGWVATACQDFNRAQREAWLIETDHREDVRLIISQDYFGFRGEASACLEGVVESKGFAPQAQTY